MGWTDVVLRRDSGMPEPTFDLQQAHRWFAIELNNRAWDVIEVAERTTEDMERMLHSAHASVYHWSQVGTALNQLRGYCLLVTAYTAAGLPEGAARYARRCLELSGQAGAEQTAFDRATVHGCAARAFALCGENEAARSHYESALAAAAALEDPEDRAVFERLYPAP